MAFCVGILLVTLATNIPSSDAVAFQQKVAANPKQAPVRTPVVEKSPVNQTTQNADRTAKQPDTRPRQVTKRPIENVPVRLVRLVRIDPDSAHPGDRVRIVTAPMITNDSLVVVTFAGRSAEVTVVKGTLLARLPGGLPVGDLVDVSISVNGLRVQPSGRIRVLQLPIRILSVTPNPAFAGDTLHAILEPPVEIGRYSRLYARFDSSLVSVTVGDTARREILVQLPQHLAAGMTTFRLQSGNQKSDPYELAVSERRRSNAVNWIIYALIGAVLLGTAGVFFIRASNREPPHVEAIPVLPEDNATYPLPDVPPELVSACAGGECVLYVGAGLSAAAKFPTWIPFVSGLLDWTVKENLIDTTLADSLRRALDQQQAGAVADNLVSALQGREKDLDAYLRRVFLDPKPVLPPAHAILRRIGFSAVLSTNFDTLVEQAFKPPQTSILTPADATQLQESLAKRMFFVLKLYGLLDRPGTVLVAPEQYLDAVSRNLSFNQFMETLFFSRPIFFVGASIEGIEDYLKGITFRENRGKAHYALVNVTGTAWQAKAASLNRRYGIQVLPYTASATFGEVQAFLTNLEREVASARPEAAKDAALPQTSLLKKVTLENIGPFVRIELDLDPALNIFLGDNGLGKSTILKAIAVGLCGRDAQKFAGRLIKSGQTEGKIILQTDRNTYLTQILRVPDGDAEMIVQPARPLEAEGWLAVGFPPLRNVTWRRPDEPKAQGRSIPTPKDLLPLAAGDTDPRMDNLKQWLVDLDYMIARSTDSIQAKKYTDLRNEFFNIIDKLTPGVRLRFKEVNPVTKQVTVMTDDGEIPIEAVSQGTTSLISWIGVLLQRIYEVYGDPGSPLDRYALVLIDEIDAHMHPEWQQKLVHTLRGIFPHVQFVATTHSPLIVGGLKTEQVVRLRRNADMKVERVKISDDVTMGRADQLLTGPLFDLQTTVDLFTQDHMQKYQTLLGMTKRDPDQEMEFRKLESILQFRIPMTAETQPERRAQELVRAILRVQAGADKTDDSELINKAQALINSVSTSSAVSR
jgi:hypothetical protein